MKERAPLMNSFSSDEKIFTLNDVLQFFRTQKKKWIRIACIGGICSFLLFSLRSTKYSIDASFKEGGDKANTESSLKELFSGMGGSASLQPQAIVFMKSNKVLKPLVQKLGLQARVLNGKGIVGKLVQRFEDNLKMEWGGQLIDPDPFLFESVIYEGEKSLLFFLRFADRDHFEVFGADRKSRIAEKVSLGEKISLPMVDLTLVKTPKNLKMGTFYCVQVAPWITAVNDLRSQLKISSNKFNKTICEIGLIHRDRNFGARVLNELMSEYQLVLKQDHDEMAKNQLAYLELRQEELYEKISHTLDEHVSCLTKTVEEEGFIGIEQAKETLFISYQEMVSRMFAIDLELGHLDQMECGTSSLNYKNAFSGEFNEIYKKLQELKQQRDLLEISLQRRMELNSEDLPFEARRDELNRIRTEKESVEKLSEELTESREIASFDLNRSLSDWARSLQERGKSEEREDLTEYLENYSRLLSLRGNMLQERLFYGGKIPSELEGIDLRTAGKLFVEYNNRLDHAEASKRHYEQFREEVLRKDVELGSLSSVLSDPLSQNLIASANKIALQLKEEKYYSSKEGERWEEELTLHRKILSDHLAQMKQVEELNIGLIRDKIAGIQQASLDCINQQISVLYESVGDGIKERRSALNLEKTTLARKMEETRSLAKVLPEKLRLEKWLELKAEMGQKMIETLTQLVESRTIGHHLFQVQSKPLDIAIAPLAPKNPHLCQKALIGAFLSFFGGFFFALIRKILIGFPATLEKLQALRFPVLGTLSAFCDGPNVDPLTGPDLDLLRKVSFFLEKGPGKVIALVGGEGPDYSYALAENLGRISYKSIVLRCDFNAKFKPEALPGLLQIWNGEIAELPIRPMRQERNGGLDVIPSGGYTPYGSELIQSPLFKRQIEILKEKYDWVFILIRSPLFCAESSAALALCDKAIVTVCKEQTEQLTPFADWAYDEDRCRLNFVVSN